MCAWGFSGLRPLIKKTPKQTHAIDYVVALNSPRELMISQG